MSFFPVDNNTLINTDNIDAVQQRDLDGERVIIVTAGGKDFVVKSDIREFLTIVKNTGKEETSRAW